MNRISYSQLSLYNECPYHWKLRYIDKIKKQESNIHLIFGTAMHTTLQKYLKTMYSVSIKAANELDLFLTLQEELIKEFKSAKEKDEKDPCSKEDLKEFFDDGVFIIDWFKKHRGEYFSKRNWTLIGCEVPINIEVKNNIRFVGFLDVVLEHEPTGMIKIVDIKTSTRGWNKYQKKDKNKMLQLLLYKEYFAQQRNKSLDNINIEYFIVKRKLYENIDYPQKRIQTFTPAHGKVSMNRMKNSLTNFLDSAFDSSGEHKQNMIATPSKKACKFCEFNQTEYCDEGIR